MALCVLGTMAIGLTLRWTLAGGPVPIGGFLRWRHVHSHLGYYAVLFPLVWGVWRSAGAAAPEPRVVAAYAAAVVLTIFGFLRVGDYGPEAMAGSTVVLAVWLRDAWRNRARVLEVRDWLGGVPIALPLAAVCVPAIAILKTRDPAGSQQALDTFLALLLLGVVVPGALAAARAPAPRTAHWTLAVLLTAAWLGPAPGAWTAVGVLGLSILIAWSASRGRMAPDRRLAWSLVATGLACLGLGVIPNQPQVAIGAIHFLVLGPVLDALTHARWPPSDVQRWSTLAPASAMGAALVAQGMGGGPQMATLAAEAGTLVVLAWTWRLLLPHGEGETATHDGDMDASEHGLVVDQAGRGGLAAVDRVGPGGHRRAP